MLEIRVYGSLTDTEPSETHTTNGTLAEFIGRLVKFDYTKPQPFAAEVDGRMVPAHQWCTVKNGVVHLRVKPQGGGFGSVLSFIFPVFALANLGFTGLVPTLPSLAGSRQGKQQESATLRANVPKLNDPIPEIAGRFRRYPDLILPQRRYFVDELNQGLNTLLCIGVGKHQIPLSNVFIGESRLIALGSQVEFDIYQPGESLAGDPAAEWWHSAKEVGTTSSLASGLTLKVTFDIEQDVTASEYIFDEFSVTIPEAAGEFPTGWSSGLTIRIEQYLDYTVSGGNTITGDLDQLMPYVGMPIEIAGPNEGLYWIESYNSFGEMTLMFEDSTPVTGLVNGTQRMAIGIAGMLYVTTSASSTTIEVERLDEFGATDAGWLGFDYIVTNDAVIAIDGEEVEGDWTGPFAACPIGEVTDRFEVDVFLPNGLYRFAANSGDLRSEDVTFEYQWREAGSLDAWNSYTETIERRSFNQLGFTRTQLLGSTYRPEVRMRRIGAEREVRGSNRIQWYGLRSKLNAPTSYEGVTVMSIRISTLQAIASQSETAISVLATRVLPVRNGGVWDVETPTRSITAFAAYVAKSIGYTDDQLDLIEFDRLEDIWAARGDYYDWVHDEATVKEVLNQAFQAGYATLTVDGGKIRPVRDEVRTQFEQMYTPQNMTNPLERTVTLQAPDESDGVDVEYTDADTWTQETVECRLAGDLGVKVEKVRLDGVTSRTQAWRYGMRVRRMQKYRRWSYKFETELDALNSRYLSYVALGDDIPNYGKSAILMGIEPISGGHVLLVSEPMEFSSDGNLVAIRNGDGTLNGPYEATQGNDEYEIEVSGLSPVPVIVDGQEPPHILFGTADRWTFPALVQGITPSTGTVSVEAVNYDVRVYDDDNNAPT